MFSRINYLLINIDCTLLTKELITRLRHVAKILYLIFKVRLIRLMGQKLVGLLGNAALGIIAMLP